MTAAVGFVVIGRNEGERLRRCLEGLRPHRAPMVYVDSGSTDGSVALARSLECEVLELDPARPFSAARARNEGVELLVSRHPGLPFVQFVDGDSEIRAGWIETGIGALQGRPDACAALGRLRERSPGDSLYNRLCDLEWNQPPGEVPYVGGICMMRLDAFRKSGGFNAGLPAGEEPELSQRLRAEGWKILSLDAEMAIHDAAILRFSQWWRRSVRTGHAFAQVCAAGAGIRDRFGLRACLRTWFWVGLVPALGVASFRLHRALPASFAALYALQLIRIGWGKRRRDGATGRMAAAYALLWLPGQLAQMVGHWKYLFSALRRRPATIIEYKPVPAPPERKSSADA